MAVQFGKITVSSCNNWSTDSTRDAELYLRLRGKDRRFVPFLMSSVSLKHEDAFSIHLKGQQLSVQYQAWNGEAELPRRIPVNASQLKPLIDRMREGHSPALLQQLRHGFDALVLQQSVPKVNFFNPNGPQHFYQFADAFSMIAETVDTLSAQQPVTPQLSWRRMLPLRIQQFFSQLLPQTK